MTDLRLTFGVEPTNQERAMALDLLLTHFKARTEIRKLTGYGPSPALIAERYQDAVKGRKYRGDTNRVDRTFGILGAIANGREPDQRDGLILTLDGCAPWCKTAGVIEVRLLFCQGVVLGGKSHLEMLQARKADGERIAGPCHQCGGKGIVEEPGYDLRGMEVGSVIACPACAGYGV